VLHDRDQRGRWSGQARRSSPGARERPRREQKYPFTTFYPAEDYHRDYFARHPEAPYCRFVIAPKLEKAKKAFKPLLRP